MRLLINLTCDWRSFHVPVPVCDKSGSLLIRENLLKRMENRILFKQLFIVINNNKIQWKGWSSKKDTLIAKMHWQKITQELCLVDSSLICHFCPSMLWPVLWVFLECSSQQSGTLLLTYNIFLTLQKTEWIRTPRGVPILKSPLILTVLVTLGGKLILFWSENKV